MKQLSFPGIPTKKEAVTGERPSLGFRPLKIPLFGTSLLEASAGTGKTYTIATLYLRLLLEHSLSVREILVVTYTRAATAELRDRIRQRLQLAYQFLTSDKDSGDATMNEFMSSRTAGGHADDDRRRILASVREFDQAAIFSIHSFCQRILQDNSFESGAAFESSFLSEESTLVSEICDDYWANELYGANSATVRYLLHSTKAVTRQRVAAIASKAIGSPLARVVPQLKANPSAIEDWQRIQVQARVLWLSEKELVLAAMSDKTRMNGNLYRKASVHGKWADGMDRTLAEGAIGIASGFDKFEKFTNAGLHRGRKKGAEAPSHAFFDLCDELQELDAGLAELKAEFYGNLAEFARTEIQLRKAALGVQSFDDLLTSVAKALEAGGNSPLALTIRKRFPAALIDEFQDTDPVQYGIFRSIYHDAKKVSLFLIGDPKQAIYGFRGADIYAYLDARRDAGARRYTLGTNWRSDPPLIQGVNTVFASASNAFVYDAIEFRKVDARQGASCALGGSLEGKSGLEIVYMPRTEEGTRIAKAHANEAVPRATANSIATLLSGEGTIEGNAVVPSDVAVLVRKNAQALKIQQALRKVGVPSVVEGDASVFETLEAIHLERFLAAVIEPSDSRLTMSALTTMVFGLSGKDIEKVQSADGEIDTIVGEFRKWSKTWVERGFIQAYREILADLKVAQRLLAIVGGARSLTNFYHLGELLQSEAAASKLGPKALFRWMKLMRRDRDSRADSIGETGQVRLESDADSVKIVTIHKSKGLEYPIVYCPFLWDGALMSRRDRDAFTFHAPDDQQLLLELGSEDFSEHEAVASREALAENMRLLYVALTRAKHVCSVTWGAFTGAESSPLGYLLHQPADFDSSPAGLARVFTTIKNKEEHEVLAELGALVARSDGTVSLSICEERALVNSYSLVEEFPEELHALEAKRWSYSDSRFSSFTGLVHQGKSNYGERDTDILLRSEMNEESATDKPALVEHEGPRIGLADFPRGARVGTMIHDLFEATDFVSCDGEERKPLEEACDAALERFGLSSDWAPDLAEAILATLNTPLSSASTGASMLLSSVGRDCRIDEMEFLFPLKSASGKLSAPDIARVMRRHEGEAWQASYLRQVEALDFQPLAGYMRGFVDLIFCVDQRWYLADYKSNHLGEYAASYDVAGLREAMEKGNYYLQYLIYSVALHRYLGQRIPDYSYAKHFGGVFYLFVRGMSPDSSETGVFRTLPSEAMIDELSQLFGGE
ncbi:MAG: exodeoxyribonuclease V subunit beta [Kofleriaceae bacterium]|nr:exodeoxyribonuclease V subunit beta [Kofleriaceae bacterium]